VTLKPSTSDKVEFDTFDFVDGYRVEFDFVDRDNSLIEVLLLQTREQVM